jgi:hypothetical protein
MDTFLQDIDEFCRHAGVDSETREYVASLSCVNRGLHARVLDSLDQLQDALQGVHSVRDVFHVQRVASREIREAYESLGQCDGQTEIRDRLRMDELLMAIVCRRVLAIRALSN